jgi:hypothetical protein
MCPHTTIYVSSYYYICVRILIGASTYIVLVYLYILYPEMQPGPHSFFCFFARAVEGYELLVYAGLICTRVLMYVIYGDAAWALLGFCARCG